MNGFALEAMDSLFLKDGTPFDAGSVSRDGVGGLFPPTPETVVGALRARLARARGWSLTGRWDAALNPVLGDGPADLGALEFTGPILQRGSDLLFPAPRHLFLNAGVPRVLARPGAPVHCDLGEAVALPELPGCPPEELKALSPADGYFLTTLGLLAVMRGELPAPETLVRGHVEDGQALNAGQGLWIEDFRIGIGRDRETRSAAEGQLYATRHVRLGRGVAIAGGLTGVPADWQGWCSGLLPFGGEHRAVALTASEALPRFLSASRPSIAGPRFVLCALTPIDLQNTAAQIRPGAEWPGGTRLLSACLDRVMKQGGWSSLRREPTPLLPLIPPGSAFFLEGDPGALVQALPQSGNGLVRLGQRTRHGYGLCALLALPTH